MGQFNVTPNLSDIFKDIKTRLSVLEKFTPFGSNTAALAYLTAAQTPGAATTAKVMLNVKAYDLGNNFDIGANHRYVCPIAGVYSFAGLVSSAATSELVAYVVQNGTTVVASGSDDGPLTASSASASVCAGAAQCAAGDTLELQAFTNTAVTLVTGRGSTYLSVVRVA